MNRRTRFYVDRRNGKWLGVCAGAADYMGLDPLWVRVGVVVLTVLGFWLTIPAYLLVGYLATQKPADFYDDTPSQQQFWSTVRTATGRSIRDVNARFRDIDHRLRSLETHVTSSSRRLADDIDRLRH